MASRTWSAVALAAALASACGSRSLPPRVAGGAEAPMTITVHGSLIVPVVLYDRLGAAVLGRRATLPRLSVGGIAFDGLRVAIVDLPDLRRIDAQIAGVLGLDVLARHDVVLDFARRRLGLHPAGYAARSDAARGMARLPFDRSRYGLVVVSARFEGKPAMPAILDLGAQGSVINRAAARLLSRYLNRTVPGAPHREWDSQRLELGELALDPRAYQIEDLGVFRRLDVDDGPAILLGADVFADRAVVLAYRDRTVYVSR